MSPSPLGSGSSAGVFSGIALAGVNRPALAGQDDGIITALEAQHLDLRGVELVVLSACDTSLGSGVMGEGMIGMQRALQVAGARTAISTLWKIRDADAVALMDEFYNNLWVRRLTKLEALRQAQLAVLNDPGLVRARHLELAKRGIGETPDKLPEGGRVAPTDFRKLRSHPSLWAAFTLSGDWR
jgi:CHAT domain-containing protein